MDTETGLGMRIFRPGRTKRIYEVVIVPEDDPAAWEWYQAIRSAPERSPSDEWRPVPLVVTPPLDGRKADRATVPWTFPEVLVVRDEAIDTLGGILSAHGELLPVDGKNARLAMFVAPMVDEDALLVEASELTRPQPWSEDITIEHGVFDAKELAGRKAFTMRLGRNLQLFLREDLVDEMLDTGDVAGVAFEPIGVINPQE